jgi:hypothetical protein
MCIHILAAVAVFIKVLSRGFLIRTDCPLVSPRMYTKTVGSVGGWADDIKMDFDEMGWSGMGLD